MQRIAALLSLVIISVFGACASAAQPAASPAPPSQQSTADVARLLVLAPQANGCTPGVPDSFIAGKVQVLAKTDATFDNNFGGYNDKYRGPTPAGRPPENEAVLLRRAFELAPRWLQFHLCNQVNFVFIDPNKYEGDPEFGWAFWERSIKGQSQNEKNHSLARFIGISQASLEDNNLSLGQSETNVVQSLLRNPPVAPVHVAARITGENNKVARDDKNVTPDGDSAAWGVLAILAHEMGHMFWHDVCDGDSNQLDQRRCFPHFHRFGWPSLGSRWQLRTFGEAIPGATPLGGEIVPPLPPDRTSPKAYQLSRTPLKPEELQRTLMAVRRLYVGIGPIRFADLFSTIAPDEDIAETYKLLALTDASDPDRPRVTSLIVQGDSFTGDVVANLGRQDLCAKVQFIRTILLQPALPCSP